MPPAVELRAVEAGDLSTFFEHQRDPLATRLAAFPAREREPFMAHWAKILADDTVTARTILADGQVAGNIVSFVHAGQREAGYWLGQEFWGRGIATQALAQFLRVVRARPLYAYVARHNLGSLRVLQKCGFRIVGEDRHTPTGLPEIEEYRLRVDAE